MPIPAQKQPILGNLGAVRTLALYRSPVTNASTLLRIRWLQLHSTTRFGYLRLASEVENTSPDDGNSPT